MDGHARAATIISASLMVSHLGVPPGSLIICSRNRPDLLWETVQSVLAGEVVPDELIVVDQSDRPHPTLPQFTPVSCTLRYLWDPRPGLSRARNDGLHAARHPLVVFLDDDVFVDRVWYRVLLDALVAGGERTVVTGQVQPEGAGFVPSTRVETQGVLHRGRISRGVLYSANMAAYRETLRATGGFDERLGPGTEYPAAEDNDLCHRLLEAGHTIAYVPEAVVYHRAWRPASDFLRLRWAYGVGRGAFYAKYMRIRDPYMLRCAARDFRDHLQAAAHQWRSDRAGARGDLALAAGIIVGAVRWTIAQRRTR